MAQDPPTLSELGRTVRGLRQEAGLTIEALAAKAGMHATYLSGIERGRFNPSWTKLANLAQALELRISTIVLRAEQQRENG